LADQFGKLFIGKATVCSTKRIAVVQIDWPLQSYIKDLVVIARIMGHEVDLYTNEDTTKNIYISKDNLGDTIDITDKWVRVYRKMRRLIDRFLPSSFHKKLDFAIRLALLFRMGNKQYDLIIGVEKAGLIAAGWVGELRKMPYAYYSLELYVEGKSTCESLRSQEIKFNRKAAFTIIQDRFRANVLSKASGLGNHVFYYLPIGVTGNPNSNKTMFFQDKFFLDHNATILLYFGIIDKGRYCEELVDVADILADGVYLILHGLLCDAEICQDKKNVLLSTSFVEEERIQELISSCHIGLALYDNSIKNDRYTAFSSQKIALYLRSGVPIITFENECYQSLFSEFKCGIPLKSIEDLGFAVQEIMSNYTVYQEHCLRAYEKYYNLEATIPPIINSI
jgi:hypothetical protein